MNRTVVETMSWLSFGLLGALFWGTAPVLGKLGLVRADPTLALALRSFVISLVLLLWLFLSGNLGQFKLFLQGGNAWLYLAGEGLLASLAGHLAYYYALKYGEASRVTPVMAAYPVVTVLLVWLFLGEKLTWSKVVGVLLIVAGVILLKK